MWNAHNFYLKAFHPFNLKDCVNLRNAVAFTLQIVIFCHKRISVEVDICGYSVCEHKYSDHKQRELPKFSERVLMLMMQSLLNASVFDKQPLSKELPNSSLTFLPAPREDVPFSSLAVFLSHPCCLLRLSPHLSYKTDAPSPPPLTVYFFHPNACSPCEANALPLSVKYQYALIVSKCLLNETDYSQ